MTKSMNFNMTIEKAEVILNSIDGWTQQEGQALNYGAIPEKELFQELLDMYPELSKKYNWY